MTRCLHFAGWLLLLGMLSPSSRAADRPVIVAFGDSVTAERGDIEVYPQLLAKELGFDGGGVTVINAGIGGHTTTMGKRRFRKEVLELNPDVVVIMFGINDAAVDVWKTPPATEPRVSLAAYRDNLTTMVRALKKREVHAVLMTPNPIHWVERTRELYGKPPYRPGEVEGFQVFLRNYVAAVREVAAREKVGLVDVCAAFKEYDASRQGKPGALTPDGMHPASRGHRIIADLLIDHLAETDPRFARNPSTARDRRDEVDAKHPTAPTALAPDALGGDN